MLTGISSMATRQLLAELATEYQGIHGEPVAVESIAGVEAARRVRAGEAFDFAVLAADALDALIASGHVVRSSRVEVARSAMAMAVRAGTAPPRIDDAAALSAALLRAHRVGYSTGPSGTHLLRLFERWGVMEELRARLVQAPAGVPVGTLIARGEVDLGFQQLSELIHVHGIVVLDLPAEAQSFTIFSAGVCEVSRQPPEAAAFLGFLASPGATPAKQRHGMEPPVTTG